MDLGGSFVSHGGPWSIRAFDGVRKLKYVCEIERSRGRQITWLASDSVDASRLTQAEVVQQIHYAFLHSDNGWRALA